MSRSKCICGDHDDENCPVHGVRNAPQPLANSGKTWTPQMDKDLIQHLKMDRPLEEVAFRAGRSAAAIIARMQYLVATEVEYRKLRRIIAESL